MGRASSLWPRRCRNQRRLLVPNSADKSSWTPYAPRSPRRFFPDPAGVRMSRWQSNKLPQHCGLQTHPRRASNKSRLTACVLASSPSTRFFFVPTVKKDTGRKHLLKIVQVLLKSYRKIQSFEKKKKKKKMYFTEFSSPTFVGNKKPEFSFSTISKKKANDGPKHRRGHRHAVDDCPQRKRTLPSLPASHAKTKTKHRIHGTGSSPPSLGGDNQNLQRIVPTRVYRYGTITRHRKIFE